MNELKLAKELIKFPSVTPKDAGAIRFVSKQLKKLGFNCKILEFKDKSKISKPIKNIYARLGKKSPNLCYAGHTDVVPTDGQDWHTDPFSPEVKDQKLFGRGTCDMKGFNGTALALIPEMHALRKPIHNVLNRLSRQLGLLRPYV